MLLVSTKKSVLLASKKKLKSEIKPEPSYKTNLAKDAATNAPRLNDKLLLIARQLLNFFFLFSFKINIEAAKIKKIQEADGHRFIFIARGHNKHDRTKHGSVSQVQEEKMLHINSNGCPCVCVQD